MLRNSKAKGALSPREVEAAWRRKLIDRLAGIEVEGSASPFDHRQPAMTPLGANRQRSLPAQTRTLRDVIKPGLVARGIRNDIGKLTGRSRGASKGMQMFAVSLSSALLTGLIWVSAYAVISDSAPGITNPIEAAVAGLFEPAKPVEKPLDVAILDSDADLAPAKTNGVADAEAFPSPGAPAEKTAVVAAKPARTIALVPLIVPAETAKPVLTPSTSAAIAPAAPPTPIAVATVPTPREKVLAMLKSSEDTVANTIGHLDANAAPVAASAEPVADAAQTPNLNVAAFVAPAIRIATVRHRIRTRIVHAQPADSGDGLSQGLMALGAGASPAKPEILPWRNPAANPVATGEVLPWLADAAAPVVKPPALRKGRVKTKVFRAAAANTAQVLPTPGQMAFVAPAPAPAKAKPSNRRAATKSPNFLEQLLSGIDQLTTVSSKRN